MYLWYLCDRNENHVIATNNKKCIFIQMDIKQYLSNKIYVDAFKLSLYDNQNFWMPHQLK